MNRGSLPLNTRSFYTRSNNSSSVFISIRSLSSGNLMTQQRISLSFRREALKSGGCTPSDSGLLLWLRYGCVGRAVSSFGNLQRVIAGFPGTDSDDILHIVNEDFTVADLPCVQSRIRGSDYEFRIDL